ncbi:MAG: hypothetical protein HON53_18920 [Planctomycetaceae bacterium]|jgi:hypothetical protein|nr:hypothetical protein [Planctomycetaceae bacterium]MBT6498265.1 hypothetical protein [Planctomycetaceae bacterium]
MNLNQAKGLFFDRKAVTSAVDRAERRVLSRFGAFVRRGARSSIRSRKSVSQPGTPPSSHTGLLKRNIFFVYEPNRSNVIIGPIQLNSGTDAPALLEHGGTVSGQRRKKRVRMTYRPRPFMGPAFERETPKLPQMWRDSVR